MVTVAARVRLAVKAANDASSAGGQAARDAMARVAVLSAMTAVARDAMTDGTIAVHLPNAVSLHRHCRRSR